MIRIVATLVFLAAIGHMLHLITDCSLISCITVSLIAAQLSLSIWNMRDSNDAVKDDICDLLMKEPMSIQEIRGSLESISWLRLSRLLQQLHMTGRIKLTGGYYHLPNANRFD